jgi:RNA recognition motif-containing protein
LCRYGDIGDVYIPRSPGSSRHRGFAFVRFRDLAAAEDAIRGMDGFEMDGKHLAVVMALNKRPEVRRGG